MSLRNLLSATHRLVLGPDFADSSRFHSAPFQRQPVNRSTGPRFHSPPLHRLKSPKTGCPGAMSAEVSPSPLSRQAAHQGLAETSALTAPPKSVRPLPLRASRGPHACPPPTRRRPPSHPVVRSQNIAAPRPDQRTAPDDLRASAAQGLQIRIFYPLSTCIFSASAIIRESEVPKLFAMAWAVSKFGLRSPRSKSPMYV